MAAVGKYTNQEIDPDVIRHMILNSIRSVNSKFRREFGELVICVDSHFSWRKKIFPYYKANRAEARKSIDVDWDALFRAINTVKKELIEIFPYRVIEVEGAEADDIIGALTRRNIEREEKTLIVSGDKDFVQLQVAHSDIVQQWDNVRTRWLTDANPKRFLFEHVLKGDRGDGIPNALSPNDSLVNKIRQKPVTSKRIEEYWDNPQLLSNNYRFKENIKLIDLRYTPDDIREDIINAYDTYKLNERKDLFGFFIQKGLKKLSQKIGDF